MSHRSLDGRRSFSRPRRRRATGLRERDRIVDVVTGHTLLVAEGSEAIWLDGHRLLVER